MDTLLLTQSQLRSLLDMRLAVKAVEQAFASHGRGDAALPATAYLDLPHHDGNFRAMPAYIERAAGVKWMSSHPDNPSEHRLPAVMALFVLNDPATALPLAVMDGTLLTGIRTGAAAGVASLHLCHRPPETIGFIGCGAQARYVLEAHRVVFGDGFEVRVADVSRQAAERFAQECGGYAVSLHEAAACDVVNTATPSRSPIVRRSWIGPQTHLNAIGADAPGKQELEPAVLEASRIFVDDLDQAVQGGEINVPFREGALDEEDVVATLGQVVSGRREPSRGQGPSIFDCTGLAIQDVALARVVYEAAVAARLGQKIDFLR